MISKNKIICFLDPDVISPLQKWQKTLTNACEELLAAKKENSEIRQTPS